MTDDEKIEAKIARDARERAKAQAKEASRSPNAGARKYTINELFDRWVYIRGLERFVGRDDPPPRERGKEWDPDVNERPVYSSSKFDKAFMSLAPLRKKISEVVLRKVKGGIMQFEGLVYRPGSPDFAGENYNVYRKGPIELKEAATDEAIADLKFFNEHIGYLFKGDDKSRNHLLDFIAWRIKNPGRKMKHALVWQGRLKGTGKSFVGQMLAAILGLNNVAYPRESDLSNKFNSWAVCQLIIVEEMRAVDRRKIKANLHTMITEERLPIERKGVDTKTISNCFGILAYTNEDAALSIDTGDRRYLVIKTDAIPRDLPAYGEGYDVDYYNKLFDLLERPDSIAAIGWELKNRDLKGYTAEGRAPETDAKAAMINAGGHPLHQWIIENAGKWPLKARLTTVEEIITIVPPRFATGMHGAYLDQNIADGLKGAPFFGVRVRVRVKGDEISLWAINNNAEVNECLRERDKAQKAKDKIKVTACNLWIAATYEADIAMVKKSQKPFDAFADDEPDVDEPMVDEPEPEPEPDVDEFDDLM